MDATRETEPTLMEDNATVERRSERGLVVTRTVNGPARIVFEAWTRPELLERWWAPKSFPISLLSCETDARVGGRYPSGVRLRGLDHGVLRSVSRSDTALAPGLDQRRRG